MISMFGSGIGVSDEQIEEWERQRDIEELDELLPKLDLFYCDEFDE